MPRGDESKSRPTAVTLSRPSISDCLGRLGARRERSERASWAEARRERSERASWAEARVGRDDFKPVAHDATGGQVALPIWLTYMKEIEKGRPVRDFVAPAGVVFARADPDKGVPAAPSKPGSRLTPFKRGTLPPAFKAASGGARFSDEQF